MINLLTIKGTFEGISRRSFVIAFERKLSEMISIPYAAAVSSGTAAMHLVLPVLSERSGIRGQAILKIKTRKRYW